MDLTTEQWKEILDAVNSSNGDMLEQIKGKLKEQDENTYQKWAHRGFDLNHLFDVLSSVDDEQCSIGFALLHIATENGHLRIVKHLIKKGAKVDEESEYGWTPLYLAAENGHKEIVTTLLENGAKVDGKNSRTPLHAAAENGHKEIVTTLLENGAKVDAKDEYDGQTPLHVAAGNSHKEIVTTLLENGADVNVKSRDGDASLHIAIYNSALEIVKALLENGAGVNIKNRNYNTPLCDAVLNGELEIVKALLENGADVNIKSRDFNTPLCEAVGDGYIEIADLIVNHLAKLATVGLYVSEENLRDEFIMEGNNNYLQHLQNCKEEVQTIKERNESLYDFLKENNVNEMVDIWERNKNVRNEFNKDLKERYPKYAHILFNKANEVKKEIFLHNHKPLIDIFSKNYRKDFQKISFAGIENYFMPHSNDYSYIEQETGVTLISCWDLEDVKEKHVPTLKLMTFVEIIKNKGADSNNDRTQEGKRPGITLGMRIVAGACCLVAAAIVYCYSRPSSSLENSDAKVVINEGRAVA